MLSCYNYLKISDNLLKWGFFCDKKIFNLFVKIIDKYVKPVSDIDTYNGKFAKNISSKHFNKISIFFLNLCKL